MKISITLDHIDSGHMALPEFQRGYVWNRDPRNRQTDILLVDVHQLVRQQRRRPIGIPRRWWLIQQSQNPPPVLRAMLGLVAGITGLTKTRYPVVGVVADALFRHRPCRTSDCPGDRTPTLLRAAAVRPVGASVFAYQVRDPERYGVVAFNPNGQAIEVMEKPAAATSNWAITGLYFYDKHVSQIAPQIRSSARGELEITDLNRVCLEMGSLHVAKQFPRDF